MNFVNVLLAYRVWVHSEASIKFTFNWGKKNDILFSKLSLAKVCTLSNFKVTKQQQLCIL